MCALQIMLLAATRLPAATNALTNPDRIPALRPPKQEIPPGFWEQHGGLVALVGLISLLAVLFLWKMLSRPKPSVLPAPVEVARDALRPLLLHEEDPPLLTKVSSVLRQYFVAAFELPREAFTNHELCQSLSGHPKLDPVLHEAITQLLEGMEHRRFGAELNASGPGAVQQALNLIDQAEARLTPPPQPTDPANHGV